MPRHCIPKYRHYKPKDLGLVVLDGRQHYLGRYGSPESRAEYNRLIQEWLARGSLPKDTAGTGVASPTINDLILLFWTRHAEKHYRKPDGTASGELANYRDTLRPLRKLYGNSTAAEFSPLRLKDLRQAMIDSGLARGTINQRVGRIVRMFKWAASEELVPASIFHGLKTLSGLSRGRSEARETNPIRPVPEDRVEAIQGHVARQVWAMIQLQRLTGMRPGEVVLMRASDLDCSGGVWAYTPPNHKMAYRGRERAIYLGPRAQEVIRPWLRSEPAAYLFSPKEAMEEFRIEQRRNRRTPLYPSQKARVRRSKPKRALGDRYSTRSYGHAIGYGCKRAGVPVWGPNRLRHNAATTFRKEFGLDTARAVLGHSDVGTTTIYAERDRSLAAAAMERVG